MKSIIFYLFIYNTLLFSMADNINIKSGLEQKFKGNVSEKFMHEYFKKAGWKQLPGEIGVNGIDGLYIKKNKSGMILDVMCAESKFNKSTIGTINKGLTKQMSKQWCLEKLDNLIKNGDGALKKDYKTIRDRVKNNNIKKRLFKVLQNSTGKYTVQVKNIVNDGLHNVKVQNLIGNKNHKINGKEINTNYAKNTESKNFKTYIKNEEKYFKKRKWATAKVNRISSVKASSNIFKSSANTTLKVGLKGASKGFIAGVSKNIPILGIGAQIAFDTYIAYKIETQGEDIEKNKLVIKENRKYIIRLQDEQDIMGFKIGKNTHNVNNIISQLYIYDDKFNSIYNKLLNISNQIIELNSLVTINKQEIGNIKDGAFTHSINKFNEYYNRKTKKEILIAQVINSFEFAKAIKNPKVLHLINYYLTIARYEQYLKIKDNFDLKYIENNFNLLNKFTNENHSYLNLLNNTYMSINKLENNVLSKFKKQLKKTTENIINKKIEMYQFEDAIVIAKNYIDTIGEDKTNILYITTLEKRQHNYNDNKDIKYYSQINIIDKYSNNLINEEVIKYLYDEGYMDKALELLKTKRFDSEDFRLEYFIKIYYLNKKEKLEKLLNLIIYNHTYSKKIKQFAMRIQSKL